VESRGNGDLARCRKIQSLLADSFEVRLFGFRHFSDKNKLLWPFLIPYWLANFLREIIADDWNIIYCYNQRYIILFLKIMQVLLRKKRFKIIYDAVLTWNLMTPTKTVRYALRKVIEGFSGKNADLVVAVSELTRFFFKSYSSRVVLLPTLIDPNIFCFDEYGRKIFRAKYGIKENEKLLGIIGPFDTEYNKPSLEFLKRNIRRFNPSIKFMVVGRCPDELKVNNKAIIFTGFVDDYIGHLSALDAVLIIRAVPTDGAINRIVEAMAIGLPVFTNPIAFATIDHATSGKDIFVFEEDELVTKINSLIFNDKLLKDVGERARKLAKTYYAQELYKAQLLEALKQVFHKEPLSASA
jgi:glycosyltransferase involved in cell wall biosynthesis